MRNLVAIIRGLCPRCRQGSIFKPGLTGVVGLMNEACSVCGLRFLRESGYFLGAMYVSYALGVGSVLPVAIGLALLGWPMWEVLAIAVVQTIICVPFFLRFSRVIWLYLDQAIDPR